LLAGIDIEARVNARSVTVPRVPRESDAERRRRIMPTAIHNWFEM
jgi:hypothetical protein